MTKKEEQIEEEAAERVKSFAPPIAPEAMAFVADVLTFTLAAVMHAHSSATDERIEGLEARIAKLEAARVRCGKLHPGGAGACILDRGHLDLHTEGRVRW